VEEGAKKRAGGFDIEAMLGRAAAIGGAIALGNEIGETIAGAIERVHDRGFSWSSIMGKYDPREDDNLIRFREGLRELREDLAKPAEVGLLESLKAVKEAAREAADELRHLRELQGIDDKARDAQQGAMRDAEAKAIQDDPNLSPEQKKERMAGLEKQGVMDDFQGRESERLNRETAALDDFELKAETAARAAKAAEEQRRRAEEANAADLEGQRRFTLEGGEGVPPEEYLRRQRRPGLGSAEEESNLVGKLDAEAQRAAQDAERARREALQVGEKNVAESAADLQGVNRQMAGIDERARPDPAVGQAAREASQAMQEGSSAVANEMGALGPTIQQSFSGLQSAVTTLAQSVQSISEQNRQTQQIAQQALEAAQQASKGGESYNR
jgi:hypothetical protein